MPLSFFLSTKGFFIQFAVLYSQIFLKIFLMCRMFCICIVSFLFFALCLIEYGGKFIFIWTSVMWIVVRMNVCLMGQYIKCKLIQVSHFKFWGYLSMFYDVYTTYIAPPFFFCTYVTFFYHSKSLAKLIAALSVVEEGYICKKALSWLVDSQTR